MTKILQYDKIQFQLTEQEANQINNWLENRQGQTHFTFRGKSLMARKMEVLEEGQENKPAFMEFQWSDEELERWETEIFENFSTFDDYLISQGVWVVNQKYPDGAVRDHKLYRELITKWSALNGHRHKREEISGHKGRTEALKKIKAKLSNKMSVEPLKVGLEAKEPDNPIQKPEEPISEERKKLLSEIPF